MAEPVSAPVSAGHVPDEPVRHASVSPERAFLAGLVRPSLPALLVAIAVATGLFAWCVQALDEDALRRPIFAVHPRDDFAFLAADALNLGASSPTDPLPDVILLASSSGREALADGRTLERAIEQAGGVSRRARPLTAGALYHLEMLALVEHVPAGSLVAVEVSERNLGLDANEAQALLDAPRLPLRSATQDAVAARAGLKPRPRRSERIFLDQSTFFLARPGGFLHLWRPHPVPELHQLDREPPPTPAEQERLVRRVRGWLRAYPPNAAWNEGLYTELVRALQARGATVVLVEALRNPAVVAEATADAQAAAAKAAYEARMPVFAAELGVERWDLAAAARLGADDFYDYAHLRRGKGRTRYTAALAARIADVEAP